jgi:hypothetical protein
MSTRFSPCHFSHSNQTVWLTGALAWLVTIPLAIAAEQPNIVLILADEYPDVVKQFETYFRTARNDSPDWPIQLRKSK